MWNAFFPTDNLKEYLTLHKEEGKWTNDLLTKATALYLGKALSAVVMTPTTYKGGNKKWPVLLFGFKRPLEALKFDLQIKVG